MTGIGRVEGVDCVIVANDATVKGGTYYPMTVKKHLRAQEIALENRLPCLYLVDSGGAFLPLQDEVFPDRDHFGRIFYNQAQLSARGVPQVALVMGSCTAGGAYVPAMSDETVIVKGTGTIFLGGPPLVKAATGEEVSAEELGGAEVHTTTSGVADHFALDDEHALAIGRQIVRHLAWRKPEPPWEVDEPCAPSVSPIGPVRRHPGRCAAVVRRARGDRPAGRRQRVPRVQGALRGDARHRLRAPARLPGRDHRQQRDPVQRVGAEGRALRRARQPAAHPARLPPEHHRLHGRARVRGRRHREGRRQAGDRGDARRTCPKFTVIIGGSFGAGNYGMAGRAYGPRQLWMWPNARISVMGGAQAARVLSTVSGGFETDADRDAFEAPILEKYEREGSPYYSTARLWDDGVIDPLDTRRVLALGISAALNAPIPEPGFSLFRM